MKKFRIQADVTVKLVATIEAEDDDSAWTLAETMLSEYPDCKEFDVTDCVDGEVWGVDEIKS